MTFKVYKYEERDEKGRIFYAYYTIKDTAKPLNFNKEKLVSTFEN